jgi:large subunit ribosomal protein L15
MNLNDVKSVPVDRKRSFRVGRGRGSGWGKTSRRGHKGAASRTGWGGGIMREGGQMPLVRRVPKKGFGNSEFRIAYEVVNVDRLAPIAVKGAVDPDVLKAAGLIKKSARWVKILGDGDPGVALQVSAHHFSRGAREKIEKAGGAVTVLPGRHGKLAPASRGERHAALALAKIARQEKDAPRRKAAAEAAAADAAEKALKKAGKAEKAPKTEKAAGGAEGGAPHEKKPHQKPGKEQGHATGHKPGEKPGDKPGKKHGKDEK